jgi:aquaporin NIP
VSDTGLLRRAGAELIGAYAMVTAAGGAIVVNALTGDLGHIGNALTAGLVILVMVAACGHISGAHFNPAVTIAFALTRHFPWLEVPVYIAGQLLGAVLGALTLRLLFGPVAGLGANLPRGDPFQALGLEIFMSALLMFVITSVATDTRASGQTAAIAIGATVALASLFGGPISGASMNPARSFGPALVAGQWLYHWVYWVGPIVGAGLGALAYQWLRQEPTAARELSNERS